MKKILLAIIRFYQQTAFFRSSLLAFLTIKPTACRFQPSCSQYTYDSIAKYGMIKGVLRGLGRIFKCHPFNNKFKENIIEKSNIKTKDKKYKLKYIKI
jgi:putative membrane protein insertion efficiency factor